MSVIMDHNMEMTICAARALQNDPELVELNLSHRDVSDLDVSNLAVALQRNVWVRRLDLSGNNLGPASGLFLAEMLLANTAVTSLDLSGNPRISEEGASSLLKAVPQNPALLSINLEGCGVPHSLTHELERWMELNRYPEDFKKVIPAVERGEAIRMVDLSGDYSGLRTYSAECISRLMAAISANPHVKILRLDNNFKGDHALEAISLGLQNNTTITTLGLRGNRILPHQAKHVVTLLTKNRTLTEVDLADNEISDLGAKDLLAVLEVNPTCTKLLLPGNDLSSPVLAQLERALCLNAQPPAVKDILPLLSTNDSSVTSTLQLSGSASWPVALPKYNSLTAVLLSDVLRANVVVTALILSDNDIGPDGGLALAEMLRVNRSLTVLSLRNNHLADEGARALVDALAENDVVVHIDLRGNGLSHKMEASLERALTLCRQPMTLRKLLPTLLDNIEGDSEVSFACRLLDPGVAGESDSPVEPLEIRGELFPRRLTRLDDSSVELLARALRDNHYVRTLNLSYQNLTDAGVLHLEEMLRYNRSITSLDLSHNPGLTNEAVQALIRAAAANDVLQEAIMVGAARVSENWRRELARAVQINTYPLPLKRCLPRLLNDDSALRTLSFTNSVRDGVINDSACEVLVAALTANTMITSVDLSDNTIGDRGVEALAGFLKQSRWLWYLSLSHNGINADSGVVLAGGLQENSALKRLDLSHNCLCDTGGLALEAAMLTNTTLRWLDISSNFITKTLVDSIMVRVALNAQPAELKRTLLGALSNDPEVTEVYFPEPDPATAFRGRLPEDIPTQVPDDDLMRSLVFCLSKNTVVQTVSLCNGTISDAGCETLAELLRTNTTLRLLRLCSNAITDKGVARLVEVVMRHNHTLEECEVEGNPEVSGAACRRLRMSLALNTQPSLLKGMCRRLEACDLSVKTLRLCDYDGSRYYDDSTCEILAYFLSNFENGVQRIMLNHNVITDAGCAHLADVLAACPSLTALELEHNQISDEGLATLTTAVGKAKSLVSLPLSDNVFTDSSATQLLENKLREAAKRTKTPPAPLVARKRTAGFVLNADFDEMKKVEAMILAEALGGTHVGW
eukprot:RCo026667